MVRGFNRWRRISTDPYQSVRSAYHQVYCASIRLHLVNVRLTHYSCARLAKQREIIIKSLFRGVHANLETVSLSFLSSLHPVSTFHPVFNNTRSTKAPCHRSRLE